MDKKSGLKDVEIVEEMVTSLVELLEEKGVIKEGEFDKKLKERLKDSSKLTKFDKL